MGAGFKLVERRLQAGERLFAVAAAPEEEAEVCDDLALVMIVPQFAEDGGSILETVERALVVPCVAERQGEILPPEFLGPLPCDQSAARENVPPACDGAPEDPHGPSNLAGQVLPARERDNANPTGGGEEREEGEEGEGDELAEADGGEEAEDSEHEANECGEPLAQAHTVRRRLERRARGCEDAFSRHVRGVFHHLIHS